MNGKLTKKDLDDAKEFADLTAPKHYSGARGSEIVYRDIIQGKMGEIGYYDLYKDNIVEPSQHLVPSEEPDPGWDFVLKDGTKVDVKTVRPDARTITLNSSIKADEYHVVEIGRNGVCEVIHKFTNEDIFKQRKPSKFGFGFFVWLPKKGELFN